MSIVTAELELRTAPRGTTLADLAVGAQARIVAVHEAGALGERLMEMGLTPGTPVTLVRRGLLGDPLQLEVRGYMLSLRRAQARCIDVMPQE